MELSGVRSRSARFLILLFFIALVQDGPPQVASELKIQSLLLPITLLFVCVMGFFLFQGETEEESSSSGWTSGLLLAAFLLELFFVALFLGETTHYAAFGYHLHALPTAMLLGGSVLGLGVATCYWRQIRSGVLFAAVLGAYAAGQAVSILSFPVNYLRSDMLSVILWADRALLVGANPYQHFHVADRIYDFPYLPGMILSFLPATALHVDPRWAAMAYIVGAMALLYWATAPVFRSHVAGLIGLFVLCPYLQYRHELYTQGHFFSLVLIIVLLQRGRFAWAAVAFGASMFISQFSWVIFPFFLMYGLRRGGWREVGRMALVSIATAAVLMAPFLASRVGSIAHNAVGQWDALTRPIARPMNLAFWASYLVRPVNLKWLQLAILTGIFCFCWAKGRCADLADMLRWMVAALTIFILLNVLIDGYFYLMLLVPMLLYTVAANGWLRPAGE